MIPINMTREEKVQIINRLKTFFEEERSETIGDLAAENLLDFMLKELGPYIYNRAVCPSAGEPALCPAGRGSLYAGEAIAVEVVFPFFVKLIEGLSPPITKLREVGGQHLISNRKTLSTLSKPYTSRGSNQDLC